jgi:hypothetical protein
MGKPQSVAPLPSIPPALPTPINPEERAVGAASNGAQPDPSGWAILLKIVVYLLALPMALLLAVRYLLDRIG